MLIDKVKNLGSIGLRVLAVSYKDVSLNNSINDNSISNLTYLGLIALNDPPKKDVCGHIVI